MTRISVEDAQVRLPELIARLQPGEELQITNSSAVDLVAKLAKGELKAVAVATAFCKRAAIAHQVVCSTDVVD